LSQYRYIQEANTTAAYGLAADEYLLDYHQGKPAYPATLRLYNYQDYAVLAGRFQDINAEIDIAACKQHNFGYSRRLTGGGAILMGSGQLGICFATTSKTFKWENIRELYHLFSAPVIAALSILGIEASFRSKNDLEVNGKKIAGLGVHVSADGAIQFHTSLLIDLDIGQMLKVLKIPIQKYSDNRKISAVEQRITTVSRELGRDVRMEEVIQTIKHCFAEAFDTSLIEDGFSVHELESITQIEHDRYASEDWIFQRSPQVDMTGMSLKKTPAGLLRTYIGLKGETIKSVLITGDFFEQAGIFSQIESDLKWSSMAIDNIRRVVERALQLPEFQASNYGLTPEVITQSIWLAAQRAMAAERYTYKGSCYYPKEVKEKAILKES
jgi:lipoate---protein ligase